MRIVTEVPRRPGQPPISLLGGLVAASSSAAGHVLVADRARLRSSCYLHKAAPPTFAAAVLDHGHVIAALGVTSTTALHHSRTVVSAAAQLSTDLSTQP